MWIFLNFPMVILSVEVMNKSIYWKIQIFHCPPTIFHWWKIFLPSKFRLVLISAIPHLNCNQIASYSQLPLPDLNLLAFYPLIFPSSLKCSQSILNKINIVYTYVQNSLSLIEKLTFSPGPEIILLVKS